jgi:glucokinase
VDDATDPTDIPPLISRNAFAGTCACCKDALDLFVSAYGAECGNLALRAVATRGIYVGGGIAPKILPALQTELFLESFRAKAPMRDLLETIPVKVILNPQAGLLGAAVFANAEVS